VVQPQPRLDHDGSFSPPTPATNMGSDLGRRKEFRLRGGGGGGLDGVCGIVQLNVLLALAFRRRVRQYRNYRWLLWAWLKSCRESGSRMPAARALGTEWRDVLDSLVDALSAGSRSSRRIMVAMAFLSSPGEDMAPPRGANRKGTAQETRPIDVSASEAALVAFLSLGCELRMGDGRRSVRRN